MTTNIETLLTDAELVKLVEGKRLPYGPNYAAMQRDVERVVIERMRRTRRDWETECENCAGQGFVDMERQVAERKSDVQTFREDCEHCDGLGFTLVFEDMPGIAGYVGSQRIRPATNDAAPTIRNPLMVASEAGAVPIYQFIHKHSVGWVDTCAETFDQFQNSPEYETRIVYAAPPAPVDAWAVAWFVDDRELGKTYITRNPGIANLLKEDGAIVRAMGFMDAAPSDAPAQQGTEEPDDKATAELLEDLSELASDLHYESNTEMSQEKSDRANLLWRVEKALRAALSNQPAPAAQGDERATELPPLPKPAVLWHSDLTNQTYYGYTADHMRDYVRAALSRQASAGDRPIAGQLREPKNGDGWRVEWWNENARMMLPDSKLLDSFQSYKNGTLVFTIKEAGAARAQRAEGEGS